MIVVRDVFRRSSTGEGSDGTVGAAASLLKNSGYGVKEARLLLISSALVLRLF